MAALFLPAGMAAAETICTIAADAGTGAVLVEQGDCARRVSPASTFKLPISLMGYDSGILTDESQPELPFVKGYSDWSSTWNDTATPRLWMEKSIVWYSQRITEKLGSARFQDYVRRFGYGNQDVSGNPSRKDGLSHSWLGSSLQISPVEQIAFLRKLVRRELGVGDHAYRMTANIADYGAQPSGWHIHGKTGAMQVKGKGGKSEPFTMIGWFVGWAVKGDRTVVFARLIEEHERISGSAGRRARDAVIRDLFAKPAGL